MAKLFRYSALPLLLALVAAAHLAALRPGHDWGDDFAQYVLHARNLVEGTAYAETGYLYNPGYPQLGPPNYPPVTPALLAPVYWAWGLDLEAIKGVMVAAFLVFLAALALGLRDDLPPAALLALVALVGLNHVFLAESNRIGSDLPFLALLYLALALLHEGEKSAARPRLCAAWYLAAGLTAYLAYGARTVGIVLLPAAVVADLVQKRRIAWPTLLACGLFAVLAAVQAMLVHGGGRYLDQLSADVPLLLENAVRYARESAAFWRNGYSKPAGAAMFLAVTALSLLGYVSAVRRGRGMTTREVFVVFYLTVVLLWPSYQGIRLIYPVIPLWLFYAIKGIGHPWLAARPRLRGALVAALAVGAVASYAAAATTLRRGPLAEGVARAESVELFDYVRGHTSPDDVIVFVKPRAMALFTRRSASVYHQPPDDGELWDYFQKIHARYVAVLERDEAMQYAESEEVLAYLRGFVERNRDRLERVWGNADFTAYRIRPPATADRGNRPPPPSPRWRN